MTREDAALVRTKALKVGNYKFTGRTLGKGSFAVVEEAVHVRLKVKVSVKTIDLNKCNAYVLKHLKREAAILQRLDNPYVLKLFETFKYGQMYCLVTELVRGGDLCVYLQHQRGRHLDQAMVRRICRQIASALAYLHSMGVVHRDLKLENIMLDSNRENIKLVDFGLSSVWGPNSPLRTLCGSPQYSAPELFLTGTQYGPQVDIWALGVIVYALAVGQLPFPCTSTLMRVPEKRNQFILLINQGLTQNHVDRIPIGYLPEFTNFLKGLINPRWDERLTIEEVLTDPWTTNNNRWKTVQHETLDAVDLAKVHEQLCSRLEISEDKLISELKSQPCGETAGFYNIMVYEQSRHRKRDLPTGRTKICTSSHTDPFPKRPPQNYIQKETKSKIWVVGAAQKFNEVIRGRKPLQRSIHTVTGSSSTQNSQRSCKSAKSGLAGLKSAGGDWCTTPQIGPFKAKKVDGSPFSTPKGKNEDIELHAQTNVNAKLKKKISSLHQPILPNKLKLKSPVSKLKAGFKAH